MRTRVKVCGITRLEDALAAVEAGADLLGFVFAPSRRHIEPDEAARIDRELPGGIERVGVFVNESADRIHEIARTVGLTMIQLHGSEPAEMDTALDLPVLRAIRVSDPAAALARARACTACALLIEPLVKGRAGGTGTAIDLGIARDMVLGLEGRRVFLAGGLGPENVAEAISVVHPYGVDASSGLETEPGRKSAELIRRFVETARGGMGRT